MEDTVGIDTSVGNHASVLAIRSAELSYIQMR
jgi:hypothetical protein